jgi:hypothetical protein
MLNWLSVSGTVSCIRGDDAYAPAPYWDTYTFKQLTTDELEELVDNDLASSVTLAPGQYTCLEFSFPSDFYLGHSRIYGSGDCGIGLVIRKDSSELTEYFLTTSGISAQDLRQDIRAWEPIGTTSGYFVSGPYVLADQPVSLVSADYTSQTNTLLDEQPGMTGLESLQIIRINQESKFISLQLKAITPVNLDYLGISTVVTSGVQQVPTASNHLVSQDVAWWVADQGAKGHFEAAPDVLSAGQPYVGNWDEFTTWSGSAVVTSGTASGIATIRQVVPNDLNSAFAGARFLFRNDTLVDLSINAASFMPTTSRKVSLDFSTNSSVLRVNLKGDIVRWRQDNGHYGHFEGNEVDIDNGTTPIMYDANVIGIRASNHGLSPGDVVVIRGTSFYDGIFTVMSYSTPHIIVIFGIYDSETFTSAAKVSPVISIGPERDIYGRHQRERMVVPYCRVDFSDNTSGYILSSTDYGKSLASVELGPEPYEDKIVLGIYDVVLDGGALSSMPGPSTTPEYTTSIPSTTNKTMFDITLLRSHLPDISQGFYQGGGGAGVTFRTITESDDPAFEGNWTDWPQVGLLFDHKMSQPLWTLASEQLCAWVTMCYRGPQPVKFIMDFGEPVLFSKYRMWLQSVFCPDGHPSSKPRSWKIQGTNDLANESSWVTLDDIVDFDPDEFVSDAAPPDEGVGGTSEKGPWRSYRNVELYRYYRLHIYEVWSQYIKRAGLSEAIVGVETSNISELYFSQHRSAAGIFATVVSSDYKIKELTAITPAEHLRAGAQTLYAFSFDQSETFWVWKAAGWKEIVRYSGQWQYYDAGWKNADPDELKAALWQAFACPENQMFSDQLAGIPPAAYKLPQALPGEGYVHIGIGLVSTGMIESIVESITLEGNIINPNGLFAPHAITFDTQPTLLLSAGQENWCDWINASLEAPNDFMIVMDVLAGAAPVCSGGNYFYRASVPSAHLQSVSVEDYLVGYGHAIVGAAQTRTAGTVTLPLDTVSFQTNDLVRVSGTDHYDGVHTALTVTANSFDIVAPHYSGDVPIAAFAAKIVPIGLVSSDIQVGSVVEFDGPGSYGELTSDIVVASGAYTVTESVCCPPHRAANLFDVSDALWFHSGQPMHYGPVSMAAYFVDGRSYDQIRLKSADNDYYWDVEFPRDIVVAGSNLAAPSLLVDTGWTTLYSGSCNLPAGPALFSGWCGFTTSGHYAHYRLRIDSNYGAAQDCVRIAGIEFGGDQSCGFHVGCPDVGYGAHYLADNAAYSQYVSDTSVTGTTNIGVDFRGQSKKLTGYTMWSVKESAVVDDDGTGAFPKRVLVYGTNVVSPDYTQDTDWVLIDNRDISASPAPAATPGIVTTAFVGDTFTTYQNDTPGYTASGIGGYSVRVNIPMSRFSTNGNKVRVMLAAPPTHPAVYRNVAIARAGLGLEALQVPVEVTFSGGLSGITIPASGTCWSDWTTFEFNKDYNHLCILDYADTYQSIATQVDPYVTSYYAPGRSYRYQSVFPLGWASIGNPIGIVAIEVADSTEASYLYYKFKVTSTQQDDRQVELSGIDLQVEDYANNQVDVHFNDEFPLQIFTVPQDHQVTSIDLEITEGLNDLCETLGNQATADSAVSDWTVVNREYQLENGRALARVGVSSDTQTDIFFKLFRLVNGSTYKISEITSVTHSGTGFQWFDLNVPHVVPDTGSYFLGWYQQNYPVKMCTVSGGQMDYEYGNFTGNNITLSLSSQQRPCLAYQYSSCFTVGTQDDPAYFFNTFSPVLEGHLYVSEAASVVSASGLGLWVSRTSPVTTSGNQGRFRATIHCNDTLAKVYGAASYTFVDTGHIELARPLANIIDQDAATYFDQGNRKLDDSLYMTLYLRFDGPTRLSAVRLRASNLADWVTRFPRTMEIMGSNEVDEKMNADWVDLYGDEGYAEPDTIGAFADWVYFDGYADSYRYYKVNLYHYAGATRYSALSAVEFMTEVYGAITVDVTDQFSVIRDIGVHGLQEVELHYRDGDIRPIKSIQNTFGPDGNLGASPSIYFFNGLRNRSTTIDKPLLVTSVVQDVGTVIPITYPELAGMGIMAWHKLDETSDAFMDSSGNGVVAIREGLLGVQGVSHAASKLDNDNPGHGLCSLPSRLPYYTVSFWFKPAHNIYPGYPVPFDIMGGLTSYGAIPGNWYISMTRHFLFQSSPYPYLQQNSFTSSGPYWEPFQGCFYFGNQGACIRTHRNVWSRNTWYHITFGFTPTGPYKVWINGAPDDQALWMESGVYPPSEVIMVDEQDIHYDDFGKANCMYFGLPLKEGQGVRGEFALSDVMHFNRLLSTDEVFRLYRMRGTAREEWDAAYFTEPKSFPAGSKLFFDYETATSINKVQLIGASSTTLVTASGSDWEYLGSGPSFTNVESFTRYAVELQEPVSISGVQLLSKELIPTVSGVYTATVSGMPASSVLLETSLSTSYPEYMRFSVSRSGVVSDSFLSQNDVEAMQHCEWAAVGSGDLTMQVRFATIAQSLYPVLSGVRMLQTDWQHTVPSWFSLAGVPASSDAATEWIYYPTVEPYHFIHITPSTDYLTRFAEGLGYFTDGDLSCSGTLGVSGISHRQNDLVHIAMSTPSGILIGDLISFHDPVYTGMRIAEAVTSSGIQVYADYLAPTISGELNRVIADPTLVNRLASFDLGDARIITVSGQITALDQTIASGLVNHIDNTVVSGGCVRVLDVGRAILLSAEHGFSSLGRLVGITVSGTEPAGSMMLHAVSFDSGTSFSVYRDGWDQVIKHDGVWQYLDGTWQTADHDDVFVAFGQALNAGTLFDSEDLATVAESDWHGTGGITSTSGSVQFITAIQKNLGTEPALCGYQLSYVDRPGITELIPAGYAYQQDQSPIVTCMDVGLELTTVDELSYGRKDLSGVNRMYLFSDAGIDLTQVSFLDGQTTDASLVEPLWSRTYQDNMLAVGSDIPLGHLHNGIVFTGGILLQGSEQLHLSVPDVSLQESIFFADLRVYFDSDLGVPTLSSVAGPEASIGWEQHDTYLSRYCWSSTPITSFGLTVSNDDPTCSGMRRIHEVGLFDLDTRGWDSLDGFNVLEASSVTSISGSVGLTHQPLGLSYLERLCTSVSGAVPVFPGRYVGAQFDLPGYKGTSYRVEMVSSASGVSSAYTLASGVWTNHPLSYSGGIFYAEFEPSKVTGVKVYYGNPNVGSTYQDIDWLRAVRLLNHNDSVLVSGADLPTRYYRPERIQVVNQNRDGRLADARVLPRYSGDYGLDRAVELSRDTVEWRSIDDGVCLPEDAVFELGTFDSTLVSGQTVGLVDGVVSGTWTSPVLEVLDPSSTAAYVYCGNRPYADAYATPDAKAAVTVLEARSGYTKPMHSFLVLGVNTNTYSQLETPYKLVAFTSDGELLSWRGSSTLNKGTHGEFATDPGTEIAPIRPWDYTQRPPVWQFYPCLDSSGFGAGVVGADMYGGYYLNRVFPHTGTFGSEYGADVSSIHIYTRTNVMLYPIFCKPLRITTREQNGADKFCWQSLDVVCRTYPFYERYQDHYFSQEGFHLRSIFSFYGDSSTPEANNEIDYLYSFVGDQSDLSEDMIRCAACVDTAAGADVCWFHFVNERNEYYKTLLLNGTEILGEFSIQRKFNFMVESAASVSRGFWGIEEARVCWYEFDGTSLTEVFCVDTDGDKPLKHVIHGSIDARNNLWFVDLLTERVVRINFETQQADYSRVVTGIASVYADPFTNAAYLYIIQDPEFLDNDCIKLVQADSYDYLEPEFVCTVPGTNLSEPTNIYLVGRSMVPDGTLAVLPEDPAWGSGSTGWSRYVSGSPTLPKGPFKQFRVTLQRRSSALVSPTLDLLRVPQPTILDKIPYQQGRDLYVDTASASQNPTLESGQYDVDLLVWWPKE